jgi:hypothetical protein
MFMEPRANDGRPIGWHALIPAKPNARADRTNRRLDHGFVRKRIDLRSNAIARKTLHMSPVRI